MIELKGIVPPVATPMNADGSVDLESLRKLLQHLIRGGVHALFVLGSTGEFTMFTDEEKARVVETAVDVSAGRLPVLAGVGEMSTRRVINAARDAKSAGADALVLLLPFYYNLRHEKEKKQFFLQVADAVELPMVIYENPHTTKLSIAVETVMELSEDGRFIATKDSSGDMRRVQTLLMLRGKRKDFGILQGSEELIGMSLLLGADGGVPGIANLVPRLAVKLYEAAQKRDIARTLEIQKQINELRGVYLQEDSSVYGGLKYALSLAGLCKPHIGSPLLAPERKARENIRKLLRKYRII